MTDEALYDQRVQAMAENIARIAEKDQEAADAYALIVYDAVSLYLVGRFGPREMARQFYRRADALAVKPERERDNG